MNVEEQTAPHWHTLDTESVLAELDVDPQQGLSNSAVQDRRLKCGSNELIDRGLKNPWRILAEQFRY